MSRRVPRNHMGRFSVRPDTGCETVDETGVRRLLVFLADYKRKPWKTVGLESVEPYAAAADRGGNERRTKLQYGYKRIYLRKALGWTGENMRKIHKAHLD